MWYGFSPCYLVGVLSIADDKEHRSLDEHHRSIVDWDGLRDGRGHGPSPNLLLLPFLRHFRSGCDRRATYYYYVQPTYQYQVAPTTYAPQYYQTAYTPQYYQQAPAPRYYQAVYQTQAPQASTDAQVAQTSSAPVVQSSGDPYGFTQWLNSVRASYGLSAVGYDPNLSSWAAENNNQQAARGMGHL